MARQGNLSLSRLHSARRSWPMSHVFEFGAVLGEQKKQTPPCPKVETPLMASPRSPVRLKATVSCKGKPQHHLSSGQNRR